MTLLKISNPWESLLLNKVTLFWSSLRSFILWFTLAGVKPSLLV